jgi:hypothetical protein
MTRRLWVGSLFGFLLGLGLAILLNPPTPAVFRGDPSGDELAKLLLASWLLLAFSGFVIGGVLGFVTRKWG